MSPRGLVRRWAQQGETVLGMHWTLCKLVWEVPDPYPS